MDDIARSYACARHLDRLGLSPLPSRSDLKRPDVKQYARAKLARCPEIDARLASREAWGVTNIQVICGVQSYGAVKILVVDCDGSQAEDTWDQVKAERGGAPPTWTVRTGGGGLHEYYRIPDGLEGVPSGVVWGLWNTWTGRWEKHKLIEILGDGKLAVCPPSIHVETGNRYEFLGIGPNQMPLPALAPDWILGLKRLGNPTWEREKPAEPRRSALFRPLNPSLGADRNEVLRAIPNKIRLAIDWGVRFSRNEPNAAGWVACFTGPEDRQASGSFHAEDGIYKDFATGNVMSLFDLGAALGQFPTWMDCLRWCESTYLSPYAAAVRESQR